MSSLFDMISSFIALLMSAAFLHFGAASGENTVKADPPVASSPKAGEQSSSNLSSATGVSGAVAGWQAKSANQPVSAGAAPAKTIRQASVNRP